GLRLWPGAALYVDPEVDQGYGLSNTLGVAGFPSGEAYKVGRWRPYVRTQRLFLRQVYALGPATGRVEPGPNALAGLQADDRLTLTVGKFSVVDIFDTNAYAHDPRADFMNWAVIDAGAFDYAADSWGYTLGAALEWTRGDWTLRGGAFALSQQPNAETLDRGFGQRSWVLEAEHRHALRGRPGAVRLLAWVDRGRIGRYDAALALAAGTGAAPDTAQVRRPATKSGWAVNIEQALAEGLGFFARLSANDGRHEAYDFTEIDRAVSAGLVLQGAHWHRPDDTVGLALAVDALAADARAYFAAGGLGILIGDGQLPHYGPERIAEAYYAAHIATGLTLSADFQHIEHPAYNRDRGPVRVLGLRLHAEF
ncbi:MAG: carbohydrate porin, partial [Burkholderiales bacterium]|nr:carbohydrate porin [Burkholderiales bacterium]